MVTGLLTHLERLPADFQAIITGNIMREVGRQRFLYIIGNRAAFLVLFRAPAVSCKITFNIII